MAIATESKQEQLDSESISEYIRESKPRSQELSVSSSKGSTTVQTIDKLAAQAVLTFKKENTESQAPDVLETLWPGVHHHDFAHTIKKKQPVFYAIVGFLAGTILVSLFVWCFSILSSFFAHNNILPVGVTSNKTDGTGTTTANNENKVLIPLASTYEVQEGDTLAAIALRNYKHLSPRLLDTICRANNLTDANVLNLGQKITLPEYAPQQ